MQAFFIFGSVWFSFTRIAAIEPGRQMEANYGFCGLRAGLRGGPHLKLSPQIPQEN